VLLDADSRQQQDRDLGPLDGARRGLDQLVLVGQGEAVVEGGAAETVAVADLDHVDAGAVEGAGHRHHLLDRDLVALGVGAVAQGRVDEGDAAHAATSELARSFASSSPTATAAAVMMSRLPA